MIIHTVKAKLFFDFTKHIKTFFASNDRHYIIKSRYKPDNLLNYNRIRDLLDDSFIPKFQKWDPWHKLADEI